MKKIYLVGKNANNNFILVDDDDFPKLIKFKWYNHLNRYAYTKIKGKSVLMHRLILNAQKNILIDHKDENGFNNQKSNIRLCSKYKNNIYRKKNHNNKSGYKGVVLDKRSNKNPWIVYYSHNGKHYNGGSYPTKIIAALKYNEIVKELHGKFAYLNKITISSLEHPLTPNSKEF